MDDKYWPLIQTFLEIGITILAPLFFGFLAYLFNEGVKTFKQYVAVNQLSDEFAFAYGLVQEFVKAAEQNGLTGELEDIGSEKKEWVLNELQRELLDKGIKIDVSVLSGLIEAAVYESFTKEKKEKPGP